MKRFAYKFENGEYEMTNVWEVYRGEKQDPHRWENVKFFSTHRKIENRKEMIYVRKKPKYHFRYKSNADVQAHEGRDTTITHEVIQDIVAELKEITFKLTNKENKVYKIYVSDSEIEEIVKTPNGNYFVDVLLYFEKSEPELLALKWNKKVAVEIHVTNEVKPTKIKDLQDSGIPIIEINVSKKLYIDESSELTVEDIKQKKEFIKSYYEKEIFANLVGDYSSKEYKLVQKIAELNNKIKLLEEENAQQNVQLQKYKEDSEALKAIVNGLRKQLGSKEMELSTLKNELEEIKKSIWHKLYKTFKK